MFCNHGDTEGTEKIELSNALRYIEMNPNAVSPQKST